MTALQLRRDIRARRIGVEELTRHYLARIARYDGPDGLNAVSHLNPLALRTAQEMDRTGDDGSRPLRGLPVLVEDNIDVQGLATTAGSFALKKTLPCRMRPSLPICAAGVRLFWARRT